MGVGEEQKGERMKREKIQHVVLAVSQCVIKFCTLSPSLCRTGNLTGPEPGEQIRGGGGGQERGEERMKEEKLREGIGEDDSK